MIRKRCLLCGRRIWFFQWHANIKNFGRPRYVHTGRYYAQSKKTCAQAFAIAMEVGLGDMFIDTRELT
jgi:hypothetical protein